MTTLWTVTVLLAILVMVDSVAVIALIRQVGLLHLQFSAQPAPPPGLGPQQSAPRRLVLPAEFTGPGPAADLILLGFIRPACAGCAAALPAFSSVASGLPGNERVVLVSDTEEAATRAYLAAHGITLPLVTGPHLLQTNGIPGTPYAVVADGHGNIMATAGAISTQHLEAALGQARQVRQAARH